MTLQVLQQALEGLDVCAGHAVEKKGAVEYLHHFRRVWALSVIAGRLSFTEETQKHVTHSLSDVDFPLYSGTLFTFHWEKIKHWIGVWWTNRLLRNPPTPSSAPVNRPLCVSDRSSSQQHKYYLNCCCSRTNNMSTVRSADGLNERLLGPQCVS